MKLVKKIVLLNDDYRRPLIVKLLKGLLSLRIRDAFKNLYGGEGLIYKKEIIESKIIFIHVPKAAGTSISKTIYGKRQGHFPIGAFHEVSQEKFYSYYKFAFVRNPYDRLFSAWKYLQSSPHTEDREWYSDKISQYTTFEDFVRNWLTIKNARTWKHFVPQSDYILMNNAIAVDDVFKLENMKSSIVLLEDKLGRKFDVKHDNRGEIINECDPYTEEMKMIVRSVYAKDFEVFNYA